MGRKNQESFGREEAGDLGKGKKTSKKEQKRLAPVPENSKLFLAFAPQWQEKDEAFKRKNPLNEFLRQKQEMFSTYSDAPLSGEQVLEYVQTLEKNMAKSGKAYPGRLSEQALNAALPPEDKKPETAKEKDEVVAGPETATEQAQSEPEATRRELEQAYAAAASAEAAKDPIETQEVFVEAAREEAQPESVTMPTVEPENPSVVSPPSQETSHEVKTSELSEDEQRTLAENLVDTLEEASKKKQQSQQAANLEKKSAKEQLLEAAFLELKEGFKHVGKRNLFLFQGGLEKIKNKYNLKSTAPLVARLFDEVGLTKEYKKLKPRDLQFAGLHTLDEKRLRALINLLEINRSTPLPAEPESSKTATFSKRGLTEPTIEPIIPPPVGKVPEDLPLPEAVTELAPTIETPKNYESHPAVLAAREAMDQDIREQMFGEGPLTQEQETDLNQMTAIMWKHEKQKLFDDLKQEGLLD